MFIIVRYHVKTITQEGRARLRKVAKTCESHGPRVQKSVFECQLEPAHYLQFEAKLSKIINSKTDNLRIYSLDAISVSKIKQFGVSNILDFEEPIIL
ncbi:CRISPR-associated endoribonuclease Cas2 [Leptospira interrogans serovar Grippotyphosa str. 2006006986]|uniref:CRISPR-associated endoribonuclease Cas2 n=3 Tax=Leptospira interrogans TaxID=173 RepID=A0A0E2D3F3_LEPIR|nr:CRISPR-associated endonuclease Cas2 [Leptospira interrogans]EKO85511.1 CRISPR-associated endoribonuclease Cas2 [Leptospira interrogans serovar Grippotyphosa str. Andaman]EKP85222.1 CRISPR-associated endoribonuclease Cas2 [Leptospira interrogans serovar Grippotyphosa str. 2006006986]EKR54106.1 CRISPR-associated endoribonuclease Cas2 [Leptospira interrogans str. UI 12758]